MLVHISYIQELLIFKDVNVKINEKDVFISASPPFLPYRNKSLYICHANVCTRTSRLSLLICAVALDQGKLEKL